MNRRMDMSSIPDMMNVLMALIFVLVNIDLLEIAIDDESLTNIYTLTSEIIMLGNLSRVINDYIFLTYKNKSDEKTSLCSI